MLRARQVDFGQVLARTKGRTEWSVKGFSAQPKRPIETGLHG
jgi:hypothetical protein